MSNYKLNTITADIREKLPRLMELTEGCIISTPLNFVTKIFAIEGKGLDKSITSIPQDNPNRLVSNYYNTVQQHFKIMGKEPTLYDVLEWLGKDYSITGEGIISIYLPDIKQNIPVETPDGYNIIMDLSKPYLKDQGNEVIDFLYLVYEQNKMKS